MFVTSRLVAVVVGLVVADASPSSLESPGQKSRHEVHFLVKHYGRDGRKKKGREWVWPVEDDGVARAPWGEYFKGETIFEDEARNKKVRSRWINGNMDKRRKSGRERNAWLRDSVVFFICALSPSVSSIRLIVLREGFYRRDVTL